MQVLEKDLSSGKLSGQPGELFRTLARVAHLVRGRAVAPAAVYP